MSYRDSATGTAIVKSYTQGTDYVSCEIRWGTHPNRGGYRTCLKLDMEYYGLFGDDKFEIVGMEMDPDSDGIICELSLGLTRNDDIIGPRKFPINISFADRTRMLGCGVLNYPTDTYFSNEPDVITMTSRPVTKAKKIGPETDEEVGSEKKEPEEEDETNEEVGSETKEPEEEDETKKKRRWWWWFW